MCNIEIGTLNDQIICVKRLKWGRGLFCHLYPYQITKKYGLKHAEKVHRKIESGEEGGEVQGLLEQWLREGKMTEEEALMNAADMFSAGVDTVRTYCDSFNHCRFMSKLPYNGEMQGVQPSWFL